MQEIVTKSQNRTKNTAKIKTKSKTKSKTKRSILMGICILFFLVIQGLMIQVDKMGLNSFNGVLMGFQFLACLFMVRNDYKKGLIFSYILIGISLLNVAKVMILGRQLGPLPGLCNTIIYTITLSLLAHQFEIRDKEAVTDFLTGLSNRRGLYKYLRLKVEDKRPFYVIYIDLGNFKFINDNYGHTYGDYLLKLITERMNAVIGKKGMLSRIGGDEFVLVLDGQYDAEAQTEKVLNIIREKVSAVSNGVKIDSYLSAYAGITKYPEDTTDVEALIKYADIAMYQAVKSKSQTICFFDKEMVQKLEREMELDKLIKEGLLHNHFYLVYQPQYALAGKKLRGFETLLRLRTADGIEVSPKDFIPVAEKGDLILQIDDYVLQRAMEEYKESVRQNPSLVVSINVSAKNIGSLGFADKIARFLEYTGYPAGNLEIEITEYCLVQSVETTIDNIKILRNMGVQIALDDFGTGYTSLSYLAKMPINLLKVDKSLIDDIVHDEKNRDFVNAVISMGHLMGCEVISEGVEDEEQLAVLKEQGCDFVQGYVWGKPMSYEASLEVAKLG